MQCPACGVAFHDREDEWDSAATEDENSIGRSFVCLITSCPECRSPIVKLQHQLDRNGNVESDQTIYPTPSLQVQVSPIVPASLRMEYIEAAQVLCISSKASAALSRRNLQTILEEQGYITGNLAQQIDAVLNESDPQRVLPLYIRNKVDAIRNIGNFSAHRIADLSTLQVIETEREEAEWCLEIVSDLLEHYYVRPAADAKKLAELNQKLQQAGKPPAK